MNKLQKGETRELTCICCPFDCQLKVTLDANGYEINGNKCPRGKNYAIDEMTNPLRVVTSTVKLQGGNVPVVPVKTARPIPKEKVFAVMQILSDVVAQAPIKIGDVLVRDVAGTGVDIVATKVCA